MDGTPYNKPSRETVSMNACEAGEALLHLLVELELVQETDLRDERRELIEKDVSGFTEAGRNLFEFMYNTVMHEHGY